MTNSFYVTLVDTVKNEWLPKPNRLNHLNVNEIPGSPLGWPYTIDRTSYNSGVGITSDTYGLFFNKLPEEALNIKMQFGMRVRTVKDCARFYAHVVLRNNSDHFYTLSRILFPYEWEPIHSNVILGWAPEDVNSLKEIEITAQTNPIDVCALYLYIQYEVEV